MIMSLAPPLLLLFCVVIGSVFPWAIMMMVACNRQGQQPQYYQQHFHHHVTSPAAAAAAAAAAATAESSSSTTTTSSSSSSTTPVIGILAQPSSFAPDEYDYIAASYVKWIEVGGARSIAIPFDIYTTDKVGLDDLFTQIHGILLPGGGSMIAGPPPPTVQYLLNKVIALNNAGHYFPVWGTCLGFEYLIRHVANCTIRSSSTRTTRRHITTPRTTSFLSSSKKCPVHSGFDAENISLPLQEVVPWHLYKDAAIRNIVQTQNVTMNNHQLGMTVDDFYNHGNSLLSTVWKVTSVNHDRNGRKFVSTIEPIDPDYFPLYGTQYHAEKNAFEYATYPNTDIPYEDINHSPAAIRFSIKMAQFFVQELAQRSVTANPTHVYNQTRVYPPVYTYPIRASESFEEIHVIPKKRRRTSISTRRQNKRRQQPKPAAPATHMTPARTMP